MNENRWQDIYEHLKNDGFNVYSPFQKEDECLENYIVLKKDGTSKIPSSNSLFDFYAVICYVPEERYSVLESFVFNVEQSMKRMEPMIKSTGSKTPSYHDKKLKAHTITIGYVNYKKKL